MIEKNELDAIQARVDAATPGRWVVTDLRNASDGNRDCLWVDSRPSDDYSVPGQYKTVADMDADEGLRIVWDIADAEFIAHARQDVPALLADLAAERARADQAEEVYRTMVLEFSDITSAVASNTWNRAIRFVDSQREDFDGDLRQVRDRMKSIDPGDLQ